MVGFIPNILYETLCRAYMNAVPHSTMNTNGGTEN